MIQTLVVISTKMMCQTAAEISRVVCLLLVQARRVLLQFKHIDEASEDADEFSELKHS